MLTRALIAAVTCFVVYKTIRWFQAATDTYANITEDIASTSDEATQNAMMADLDWLKVQSTEDFTDQAYAEIPEMA